MMIVNKIDLRDGAISSCQALRTADMNPELLCAAKDVLAALRAGADSIANPLPNGPEVTVALGLPPLEERFRQRLRDDWQRYYPDGDLEQYEGILRQVDDELKRTGFYIEHGEKQKTYNLILPDATEDNSGIEGTVGGSCTSDSAIWSQGSESEKQARRDAYSAVVREMVALRPAFIAPSMRTDPWSHFGDHFAVAMLLSGDEYSCGNE